MGERGNTLRRREHAARVFSSHSAFVIPVVHRRDAAADPGLSGRFDLARQVQALRAARTILADGGSVLMIDEWVADAFTAPAEALPLRLERRVGCLPGAMGDPETAATGAACGSARCGGTRRRPASRSVEVLPIERPHGGSTACSTPELKHYTPPPRTG